MNAACSLYNKLQDEGSSLCTWAGEQLPPDYDPLDTPDGHICYEATMKADDAPMVLPELKGTAYEKSDVNVRKYGLRSYLGFPIQIEGANSGALCIVDTKPRNFNATDLHIIATLAKGLELEEQRRQSEEQVRKLLNEKVLLLKEAYHRIKNDMSIVKSMLSMQASRMESARAEESLYDASHRVAVLSQVYDRLTSDDGVRRLLLSRLLDDLLQELKKRYAGESVRFSLSADEIETSSRYGIVTGIIFNELVTNAVKNMPPEQDLLQVDIECRRSGESQLLMTVVDNGAGFPPDVLDGSRMGLGLELVQALAAQYDGVLRLENSPGARVSVRFQHH
jgi:two-component sensor histidine kinase